MSGSILLKLLGLVINVGGRGTYYGFSVLGLWQLKSSTLPWFECSNEMAGRGDVPYQPVGA